ncbi:MAG: glycosyltransferase family 4 protein, partial [Candidatus Bathyarchaeia archaeon]
VITEFEHYPWIREYMYHYPFISTYARLRWEIDALLRIQLARLLMPRAKLLTSVSKFQKKMLCRHVPNICDRVIKVPNFVNTEFYKPTYSKSLREKLGDGAEVVAGFVGRLTPHKGLHVLLYSLSKMDKRLLKKLKLIVIGPRAPGFHAQYAKDLYAIYIYSIVSREELSSVVRFIGQVDESEMPKYLSAIDILIHPSFVEAFGLVLIEAMAVGTPVVAFDIPPMNEIVTSDIGFLVKPHIYELTKTLEYIVENKYEIYRRKETVRDYVEKNYSLKRIGLIFKNIYENLVE